MLVLLKEILFLVLLELQLSLVGLNLAFLNQICSYWTSLGSLVRPSYLGFNFQDKSLLTVLNWQFIYFVECTWFLYRTISVCIWHLERQGTRWLLKSVTNSVSNTTYPYSDPIAAQTLVTIREIQERQRQ